MATMNNSEFGNLIGSDKVEGTAVYGADDSKIGSIERVMIDKVSGKVSYAVLGFGGFLGLGNDHYPLPWQSLKYDTRLGGYVAGVTEGQRISVCRFWTGSVTAMISTMLTMLDQSRSNSLMPVLERVFSSTRLTMTAQ